MMLQDEKLSGVPAASAEGDELARQQAVKQIERIRRFHVELAVSTIGMLPRPIRRSCSGAREPSTWAAATSGCTGVRYRRSVFVTAHQRHLYG